MNQEIFNAANITLKLSVVYVSINDTIVWNAVQVEVELVDATLGMISDITYTHPVSAPLRSTPHTNSCLSPRCTW